MDFALYQRLQQLQARYCQVLDSNDLTGWPDFFTESCVYKLQSRENFDAGLPLCVLGFESRAMLVDRVYGVANTIYHDPYSQRHVCGAPLVTHAEGGALLCESSFVVIRTQRDKLPHILCVGRYLDKVVDVDGQMQFAERLVIFDNDLLPNSIIKPV
jgi:salicylate 5-hydroxylase small subunit